MKAHNKHVLAMTAMASMALCSFGFADAEDKGAKPSTPAGPEAQGVAMQDLGRHINPVVLNAQPPMIGEQWLASFDLSDYPSAKLTFVAVSMSRGRSVLTQFGELLVDPTQLVLVDAAVADRRTSASIHAINVPKDPSLVGLELAAQGLIMLDDKAGRSFILTNGLALRVGANANPLEELASKPASSRPTATSRPRATSRPSAEADGGAEADSRTKPFRRTKQYGAGKP